MQPTTYQQPELRDANDQIIRSGTFGKNTALSNSTNDGWIDYVMNNLEYLRNTNDGAFNAKVRLTTSGIYTAPVTGTYRITLVGGGGGGGGASLSRFSGAGGGSGSMTVIYAKMTAKTAYTYIIGAGGTGSEANKDNGTNGGATSITISGVTTTVGGGGRGAGALGGIRGGGGGGGGVPGTNGTAFVSGFLCYGGVGGGTGGGHAYPTQTHGVYGGGGCGGSLASNGTALKGTVGGIEYDLSVGGNGGNGYIEIEYFNASLL